MSKESAAKFAQAVLEDCELRQRTAKLNHGELLPIAKEMGYDFTEEELTEVMSENEELNPDDIEDAAGGGVGFRSVNSEYKTEARKHCNFDIDGPLHDFVVVSHEEQSFLWKWTIGIDHLKCSRCGYETERRV